jgi:membrane protease YdiL (CAAX protease family)
VARLNLAEVDWTVREALLTFLLGWIGVPLGVLLLLQNLPVTGLLEALRNQPVLTNFLLVLINAAAAVGLVAYFLRRRGRGWRAAGLRGFNIMRAGFWVVIALIGFRLLVVLAYWGVSQLWPAFNPDQAQTNEFTQLAPSLRWVSFLALVLIPPITEEIVFRGFMFPAMAKRWGIWAAAIASSLLFGVAHLQLNVTIYTLILGLLLCMMYYRFGSIWPGIAFHLINNYLAYSALISK